MSFKNNLNSDLIVTYEPINLPSGVDSIIKLKLNYWKGSNFHLCINRNYNKLSNIPFSKYNLNLFQLKYPTYSELRSNKNKYYSIFFSQLYFILNFLSLLKYYKKNKFNRVFIHSGGWPVIGNCFLNLLISILFNKKIALIIHNYPNYDKENNIFYKIQKKLIPILNIKLITVSKNCALELNSFFKDKKNFLVIPNSVKDPKIGYPKNKNKIFTLIYVGELSKRKGLEVLFKSLNLLKIRIKIIIIGSGEPKYESYIKKKYKILNHEINFISFSDQVPKFIYSSDILILPSISHESFGLVLIEAMSCKTPIIASQTGGITNLLRNNKDALTFKNDNYQELLNKIEVLMYNDALKKRLVDNAYRKYKHLYSDTVMVNKYINFDDFS